MPRCPRRGLRTTAEMQFVENRTEVRLDGVRRKRKLTSNFFITHAPRHQFQHLALAVGEVATRCGSARLWRSDGELV